jgi:hypothetical protein
MVIRSGPLGTVIYSQRRVRKAFAATKGMAAHELQPVIVKSDVSMPPSGMPTSGLFQASL